MKASTDPAQFVLDALQRFPHMYSQQEDERVNIRAIRKCFVIIAFDEQYAAG